MGDLLAHRSARLSGEGAPRLASGRAAALPVDGSARGDLDTLNVVATHAQPVPHRRQRPAARARESLPLGRERPGAAVRARAWGISGPLGTISGQLSGAGMPTPSAPGARSSRRGCTPGSSRCSSKAASPHRVLSAKSMEARHLASGALARAAGTIAIVDNGPRLDLMGSWEQFRWPLTGRDPVVRSAAGTSRSRAFCPTVCT